MFQTNRRPLRVVTLALTLLGCGEVVSDDTKPEATQQAILITNPVVPRELPVEIETELAPAGSLKQAPLWHEIAQLLDDPNAITCPPDDPATAGNESKYCTADIERRPGFGTTMPPLNVWNPCFNVLTGQPLRLRVSDGEISWDEPGPLYAHGNFADPLTRPIIGVLSALTDGSLVLSSRTTLGRLHGLPTAGTVIAVPGCNDEGEPVDVDGNEIEEFEKPISELDFFRRPTAIGGIPVPLQGHIGRPAAQVLGKALFWDMQVGSDGVQACASCHFHAGADNRTRNTLNPNTKGDDNTLQVHSGPNQELVVGDFPFHRLTDLDGPGDPLEGNVASDANDIVSSMGVRFRKFGNIPPIGSGSFGTPSAVGSVRPLLPDLPLTLAQDPDAETDPIPLFQGLRRVEPRHTPTIFNTAFNFDSFWDGRARHDSNGGSVEGPTDPQFHVFVDPNAANGLRPDSLQGATNGYFRPEMEDEDPEVAEQPVRIRFSSIASLATGPALSEFEMSFLGRNWAKIGKKFLQGDVRNAQPQSAAAPEAVVPLANQLVSITDSVLGPFSNQGGSLCVALRRTTEVGKPGLCISYGDLIRLSYDRTLWHNSNRHLRGTVRRCSSATNGTLVPAGCDPFDGYVLSNLFGAADADNRNQFRQIEANFSLFFGQSVQSWSQLLISDDSPFDRFMDANPNAANAVGQPGEQGTLPPNLIPGLVGPLTLVPGFGAEEIFGFDIFSGANLTAALPQGTPRNPAGHGSNPFLRTARCMICHLGPEQTDHTNNVNAGLLLSDTEFELPPPGAPEPTGPFRFVTGISLAEEVEENAQDGVEVENRDFLINDDPSTPWDDRTIGVPTGIAFQDNGVYNIAVRPTREDTMRGATDAFGWPISLAAMAMKNLGGVAYDPCDNRSDAANGCAMRFGSLAVCTNSVACLAGNGLFEATGADQSINPGLSMSPARPRLPEYLAPWANNLPAGELHPQVDELAFAPETLSRETPFAEYGEILFGSDTNCVFVGDPNDPIAAAINSWGPRCPNLQSAVPNNFNPPLNGTNPYPNRVARNGAVKAPGLRNIELTGPYFHTGSYLTLRQVVDFYIRGGDFPITNAEDRDPNMVNITHQAFGFGTTIGLPAQFLDGIPDTISQYGVMPDVTHPQTPEPATSTPEEAKVALVKFLLSLTDDRVRFERAPFDHPEILVPLDGAAPDNIGPDDALRLGLSVANIPASFVGGREALLSAADVNGLPLFKHVPAVGAEGNVAPLQNFLGISSLETEEHSHFCR